MLIRKPKSDTDICFAWTFTPTPEGVVWLEWVRRTFHKTGFGHYSYERLPQITQRRRAF